MLPNAVSIYDINTQAAPAGLNSPLQMRGRYGGALCEQGGKYLVKNMPKHLAEEREVRERSASIWFFFYTVTEETAEPLHPNLLLCIFF